MLIRTVFLILGVSLLGACNATKPFYSKTERDWPVRALPTEAKLTHSVFLIGDAGAPDTQQDDAELSLLGAKLQEAGAQSTVVFLGDNIYPKGLPSIGQRGRQQAEDRLRTQVQVLEGHQGHAYFVPGNHDWENSKAGGLEAIKRLDEFMDSILNYPNLLQPKNGCPGPVEVNVTDQLTLILLDTQWWLHKYKRGSRAEEGCIVDSELEWLQELEDILLRNQNKHVLVTAHHPLYSSGNHGGGFPLKDHIFPFAAYGSGIYIPLPVIGSIYPLFRKWLGSRQDLPNPRYKLLKQSLLSIFSVRDHLIYAAGHEHGLQYIDKGSQQYVVSGSGSKKAYMAKGHGASFTHSATGFSKLLYYDNGEVWVEFWEATEDPKGKLSFRKKLHDIPVHEPKEPVLTELKTDSVLVVPGPEYEAGGFKRLMLGDHYRPSWTSSYNVSVIDLKAEKGGLVPIQRGGGQQTKSIRLQGGDGKQYVFRSVQKDPSLALPKILRRTFAADLVQDQISASHPFGALCVPPLAEAAGVYHTNPRMVIVPKDGQLGVYEQEFAGMLVLFEERPAGNLKGMPNFGNTKKAVNTAKVLQQLQKTNKNRVDEKALARARLLDMLLNDWDRHEDQWRWAEFNIKGGGKLYSPIPRDRDQVFFKFDGLLPWFASRKWAVRKFQSFDHDIRDIAGLGFNARHVDRTFLTSLSRENWAQIATQMKNDITNEVIEESIGRLPSKSFALDGEEIMAKLRSRRDKLETYAHRYYEVLAKEVDVVGSDKAELFEVKRLNDEQTSVTVYDLNKEGEKRELIYQRTFIHSETDEVRLYGRGEDDIFEITGEVKHGLLIRVIGGEGDDSIDDRSHVKGMRRYTQVYDTKEGAKINPGKELKDLRSKNTLVNEYDRKAFEYDVLAPLVGLGYNADQGLFLGGGFSTTHHAFRKKPYGSNQSLLVGYALGTKAYDVHYHGRYTQLLNPWDMDIEFDLSSPVLNYFGLGNETDSSDLYKIRYNQVTFIPTLYQRIGLHNSFKIGPLYEYIDPQRSVNPLHLDSLVGIEPEDLEPIHYLGTMARFDFRQVDNNTYVTRGFSFMLEGSWHGDLNSTERYGNFKSAFTFYLTAKLGVPITLAARVGLETNTGDYQFFQASVLGGYSSNAELTNLRGYRGNRFAGRSSFYQNTELRIRLFHFRTFLFPAHFGIIAFNDIGKVWKDGEKSKVLHNGYGGGIWISPFDRVILVGSWATSEEEEAVIAIGLGFLF